MQAFLAYLRDGVQGFAPTHPRGEAVQGWMYPDVDHVFDLVPPRPGMLLVEVGSWKGLSAINFGARLRHCPGATVLCVDTWLGAPEFWTWGRDDPTRGGSLNRKHGYPTVYYEFLSNVFHAGLQDVVVPFPISSAQGAAVLAAHGCRADAVYIDASHEQGDVHSDLAAYWELLAPGGVIFGDDYAPDDWPGVVHDVDRFCAERGLQRVLKNVTWFIRKPTPS